MGLDPVVPPPAGRPGAAAAPIAPAGYDLNALINAFRASEGLRAWTTDPGLEAIALSHAQALAEQARLSHDGFRQRVQLTGSHRCVENLAVGATHPQIILRAWQQSSEHLSNLLDPEVLWSGIGQAGPYVVLMACATPARPASSVR
jgi:uncharacterized protein YkwD